MNLKISINKWIICSLCLFALTGCGAPVVKQTETVPEGIEGTKAQLALESADRAYARGDRQAALVDYLRTLEHDPEQQHARYRVGVIQESRGSFEQARMAYQDVLKTEPDHVGALEGLGLIKLRQKKYAEANRFLEKVVKADQTRWRSFNGLGIICDQAGQYAAAQDAYQKALLLQPKSAKLLTNLGYSYYLSGKTGLAKEYYQKALGFQPGYEKAWTNLGLLHVKRAEYDAALSAFDRIAPPAESYNMAGELIMGENLFKLAVTYFEQAIRLSPTHYQRAYDNLARAREVINR